MSATSPAAAKPGRAHVTPVVTQLAALCWRKRADGGREVLLVSSSRGRWILPKGWPMRGKTAADTALTEAWEEAGVTRGKVGRRPLGQFTGIKQMPDGDEVPCTTRVFAIKVADTADDWPEKTRRDRIWVPVEEAGRLVIEDGLRDILARL